MTTVTIEQLAAQISKGLPKYQREANLEFVRRVHASLKEDGVWASPALGSLYQRRGDEFVELIGPMFLNDE